MSDSWAKMKKGKTSMLDEADVAEAIFKCLMDREWENQATEWKKKEKVSSRTKIHKRERERERERPQWPTGQGNI